MSGNDKKLLVIGAALILVVAIAFFGIKPAFTKIGEAKDRNAELKAQKTSMETEIAAIPSYESTLVSAKAAYAEMANRVYGDLTNDKIHDAVIDDLVLPCGLSITDFTISGITRSGVMQYQTIKSETGDIIGQGGEAAGNVRLANISVNVFGTSDQIITFVDKLNSDEGIFLQNTSFANTAEGSAVTVTFYMVLSESFA